MDAAGTGGGFIVCYPIGNHVHIENVAVRPEFQGKWWGRHLIAHAEQRAAGQGFDVVELYTNVAMTKNLAFYPRLGYENIGERMKDGVHRVYFRKHLTGESVTC